MQKHVYVLSDFYGDIFNRASCDISNILINCDNLEQIFLCSDDFDFVDNLIGDSDSVRDYKYDD